MLVASRNPEVQFRITLDTNGGVSILDVPGGLILTRPVPPPATLRAFYAGFFLPDRGSLREFCKPTQEISLRQAIRDHRKLFFNGFSPLRDIERRFSGGTSEEEEDEALDILLGCSRADDLIDLVNKLTWDRLDDELDESDLTRIMDRLKVLLDRRDYLVGFLLRWFFLVKNEVLENMVDILPSFAASRTAEVRHSFIDQSLNQRNAILGGISIFGGIGHMALRKLPTYAKEFKLVLDIAAGPEQYRAAEIQLLSWEVEYTNLICTNLEKGEYSSLLKMLAELFDTEQVGFPTRNVALYSALSRWNRHFVAIERAISILGDERQKEGVRKFMEKREMLMRNFPLQLAPPAPPSGFLAAIQQAIQEVLTILSEVGNTIDDLRNALLTIATAIGNISVSQLFGTADNDVAVAAVNSMSGQELLAILPTSYKFELMNRMLSPNFTDAVGDEEEDAVLTVLRETKALSPAEFLQLARSATWEVLDSSFNGTQYYQLEALFRF